MFKRTSNVQCVNIISITDGSFFNVGDTNLANPISKVIALQKEGATFQGELEFENYSIFTQKTHFPKFKTNIIKRTFNHNPNIYVQHSNVMAIGSSSIFQVGNLNHIATESRIKHFRIVLDED